MEEARRVIERLERIEALRGAQAPAQVLLAEVRSLLAEGESWLAAERAGDAGPQHPPPNAVTNGVTTGEARAALERCRERLETGEGVVRRATL